MPADTNSANLGYLLQGTGNNNNNWGTLFNTGVADVFERGICGSITRPVTGGSLDLSLNAMVDHIQIFTGALSGIQTIVLPNRSRTWTIVNNSSGNALLFRTSTMAQADAVIVGSGLVRRITCDGANRLFREDAEEVGVIKDFAGSSVPLGHLECDSTLYNPATFPDLFRRIGTTWGGNGITTFGLPNLKDTGRFRRSRTASLLVGTYQTNALKSHTHLAATSVTASTDTTGSHDHGALTGAAGSHDHGGFDGAAGGHGHTASTNTVANHSHGGVVSTVGNHSHGGSVADAGGSHSHGGATAAGGSHNHGGNTLGRSVGHTHTGTTDSENATHSHVATDSGHVHAGGGLFDAKLQDNFNLSGGVTTVITAVNNTGGESTASGTAVIAVGLNNAVHQHTFTTGGESVDHTHGINTQADHNHVISTEVAHQHTLTISADGGHNHVISADGGHDHVVTIVAVANHQHSIAPQAAHQHSITAAGSHSHVVTINSATTTITATGDTETRPESAVFITCIRF